ncbi:MAG: hypothetical protein FJ319_10675 [SAR202 cluster bacterium]|nr:hypothetical protein [SAR202 cluster bacterium]
MGNATRGNPAKAIELCGYVENPLDRISCIESAVTDRFWQVEGADEAVSMCVMLTDTLEKRRCYSAIIEYAIDLFDTAEGFTGFCARIEAEYRGLCVKS